MSAAVVVATGCLALLARPWLVAAVGRPVALLGVLFVVLGVAGAAWRLPRGATLRPATGGAAAGPVLAVGLAAFVGGRLLGGAAAPAGHLAAGALALNTLAAVAEEAFFRRLAYGALAPRGAAVAVFGSAIAFAAVHVTVWGLWVLPLDLAAGLVLSWQRWASGRWSVPAATHVAANVLAVL